MDQVNYLLACASITAINNSGSLLFMKALARCSHLRAKLAPIYTHFARVVHIYAYAYIIYNTQRVLYYKCVNNRICIAYSLLFTNNVLITHYSTFINIIVFEMLNISISLHIMCKYT